MTHSLVYGLNTLRNLLFQRIHEDVETNIGHDSMLLPISVEESERLAKCEIEAYQIAVTTYDDSGSGLFAQRPEMVCEVAR